MLFLRVSALSCMSALCLYFLLHWKLLSSGQIPCVCKHTCNEALLNLLVVILMIFCCHHVPQYMAFCWLAPRLNSIQCQMIVCDIKKSEVSRNTSKHKHTHTHIVFYGLRGSLHRHNVFILYKLYVLLPYTYPTPKLSPHRRLCISTHAEHIVQQLLNVQQRSTTFSLFAIISL